MKKQIIFLIIALFMPMTSNVFADADLLLIEDFTPSTGINDKSPVGDLLGKFPNLWHPRDKEALDQYTLEIEKNNFYLKAKSQQSGIQIVKKFKADLNEYPILSWKWRIKKFPGEDKNIDKRISDDGATVYVLFTGFLRRKALKYTWSNYYKKGTVIDKRSNMDIFVLRDLSDPKNVWVEESRNVLEDFKKAFDKDKAQTMSAIAVMTDSDRTETVAEAHYDDLILKKLPKADKK